jgi:hypothetical protein
MCVFSGGTGLSINHMPVNLLAEFSLKNAYNPPASNMSEKAI